MASLHYTVILECEEDGGYHVFCPTLKGCHSQGDSIEEAITNIQEAISVYLDSMKATGDEIPIEDYLIGFVKVAA